MSTYINAKNRCYLIYFKNAVKDRGLMKYIWRQNYLPKLKHFNLFSLLLNKFRLRPIHLNDLKFSFCEKQTENYKIWYIINIRNITFFYNLMHIFKTMIVLQIIHTCTTIGLNITVNVHTCIYWKLLDDRMWKDSGNKQYRIEKKNVRCSSLMYFRFVLF